ALVPAERARGAGGWAPTPKARREDGVPPGRGVTAGVGRTCRSSRDRCRQRARARGGRCRRELRGCAGAGAANDMLTPAPNTKLSLATAPTDLRRGHGGLCALVRGALELDPYAGHFFVIVGKRGDRVKVLFWDRGGFVV